MHHVRRIFAVVLLLALGLGTPAYSMEFGQSGDVTGTAAADQSAPADCSTCDSDEMAVAACVSGCIGVQAVLARAGVPLNSLANGFDRLPEQRVTSAAAAPDPFPPKLTILA